MFTFGRQAKLGRFLTSKRDETVQSLTTGKAYLASAAAAGLPADQVTFHHSSYISGVYGVFEGYLLDLVSEMLHCFPDRLKESDYKLKDFVNEPSDFLASVIEKQTDSMGYKRFDVIVSNAMALFHSKPLVSPAIASVQEFKATRDLYVHNRGIWNTTYAGKAGPSRRQRPSQGPLPIDRAYLEAGTDAMITLVKGFHDQGPRQYERFTNLKAFEEMWKASALEGVLSFSDAWTPVPASDLARPTDAAINRAWSHSEQYLWDFFLRIYNDTRDDAKTPLEQVFVRWPMNTRSAQVVLSWLRDPFQF